MTRKAGINVTGNFIIGAPGETKEDIAETEKFMFSNHIDHLSLFILTPLPSTEVWRDCVAKGKIKDSIDWKTLEMSDSTRVYASDIPEEELLKIFRKMMFKVAINNYGYFGVMKRSLRDLPRTIYYIKGGLRV